MNHSAHPATIGLLASALLAGACFGQACDPAWVNDRIPGFDGIFGNPLVYDMKMWDPDGPGPRDPLLIAAGSFTHAGGVPCESIAAWDGTSWSPLGSGIIGGVSCLETLPDGRLVAAGGFSIAGGLTAYNIAVWDGSSWSAMGDGIYSNFTAVVYDSLVLPNGDFIVVGDIPLSPSRHIMRWDGSQFVQFGASGDGFMAPVRAAAVLNDGRLVAAGDFTSTVLGTTSIYRVAYWDGTLWQPVGGGITIGPSVYALHTAPNGDLIAAGKFQQLELTTYALNVARWDGVRWHPMSPEGITGQRVTELLSMPNGDLIAAGWFRWAGADPAESIARWDGARWWPLGAGVTGSQPIVGALALLPDGFLAVAGGLDTAGGNPAPHIALWGCDQTCPADFNGDGFVTGDDFDLYVAAFELGDSAADFNQDGFVTGDDFDLFVAAFEAGC